MEIVSKLALTYGRIKKSNSGNAIFIFQHILAVVYSRCIL